MDTTILPATWQEALENHSVSNVKAFEKQLRANTLRDGEKLRILVGSNYRDLLSTAEQIVELNDKNHQAEASILVLSQSCKPPSEIDQEADPSNTAIVAAQIKLTDRFLRCASKVIKERSVLLAAKMLIIARLLLKHLEQEYGASKTVQWLTIRLKNGRQQVLKYIDAILVRPTTPPNQLVQAAGAYCLTTSSSSADVVRHFRTLRAQRLAQGPLADEPTRSQLKNDLKQRCHYFVASVTAIKMLSGRDVVDLLNTLQKHPILEDQKLHTIEALQLDTSRKLLPKDIPSFTPYFKRTVPVASELRASLQQWINDTSKYLLKSIELAIQNTPLRTVIKIRQVTLEILLSSCFSTLSHDLVATSIRETFSTRITTLIRQQAQTLQSLATEIPSIIHSSQNPAQTIWQSDLPHHLTANPPPTCLRDIRRSHLGITDGPSIYFDKLATWLLGCRRMKAQIEDLGRTRWQDKIEEYDEEDEDVATELVSSLSKTDPAEYLRTFEDAVNSAADAFTTEIGNITSQLVDITTNNDNLTNFSQVPTLLRITRESTHVLHSLIPSKPLDTLHASTQTLYDLLAQQITTMLLNTLDLSTHPSPIAATNTKATFVPPDLPSPPAILLLKTLCTILSSAGTDIWTASAVRVLKRVVLSRIMDESVNDGEDEIKDGTETNGDGEKGTQTLRQRYVKSEIDAAYLTLALGEEKRDRNANGDGEREKTEAQRRATTYWSRTRGLFGVLTG